MSVLLYSSSLLCFFLLGHNPVKCWASLVCNVSCGIYTFLCQEHYLLHQQQTLSSCRIICNLLDFTNLEVCLDIMYVGMFQNVLNILCISTVALQINESTKFFFSFLFFLKKARYSLFIAASYELYPSSKPTQKKAMYSNSQMVKNCFYISVKKWNWEISLSHLYFCVACTIMLSCIIEQEAFKICKFPDEFLNREWSYRLNTFQKQRMSEERKQIKTLFLTLLSIKAASVRSTYAWWIFKERKDMKELFYTG